MSLRKKVKKKEQQEGRPLDELDGYVIFVDSKSVGEAEIFVPTVEEVDHAITAALDALRIDADDVESLRATWRLPGEVRIPKLDEALFYRRYDSKGLFEPVFRDDG